MKIAQYRPGFTCCLLELSKDAHDGLQDILVRSGFSFLNVNTFSELQQKVAEEAPHFIVLSRPVGRDSFAGRLKWIREVLPETQIFFLGSDQELIESSHEFVDVFFDFIEWPLRHPTFVLRSFDRAAELNFYLYQNEQLQSRLHPLETESQLLAPTLFAESSFNTATLLEQLQATTDRDAAFEVFLREVKNSFSGAQVVFFKYYPPRRTLMALKWIGVEGSICSGVGLNFNEHQLQIKIRDLRNPSQILLLDELVQTVFIGAKGQWIPLEVLGEVQGLWLLLNAENRPEIQRDFILMMKIFTLFLEKIDLSQRFHLVNHLDLSTLLLIRTKLIQKLSEEVSRARRLEWPVSLIILSIDQSEGLRGRLGEEELELLLKMCARILQKHSRVNDLLGRVGPDEIGVLLPHTDLNGAAKKAERVRSLIERADFSKVVKGAGRLTVSLGVSEYPTCSADAEELYQSADLALYQVKKSTQNAVCVATPPESYKPDFIFSPVRTKGG